MSNEVAVIDTATNTIVTRVGVGTYPYTTVVSADGSKVYVSNWGGRLPGPTDFTDGMFPVVVDPRTGIPVSGTVSVISTATNTLIKTIEVGLHPTGMALSPRGDRVYVTNANSDTVSAISTASDTVVATLHVGAGGKGRETLLGSSPNAVAITADGNTLYVANATQNAIAVVDVNAHGSDRIRGLIPTGWYPTAVALDGTGQRLVVASGGYGFGSIAPVPPGEGRSYQDRVGVVSILDVPGRNDLKKYTRQVLDNNDVLPPVDDLHGGGRVEEAWNSIGGADADRHGNGKPRDPIPMRLGDSSPIKHVFYVIKENRTYDQVFGDMPQGNGDASLVQFGRDVTPNHHPLVEQFALLDNYYGPGDQSALGHRWVLQSYPSTWVHKYGNARNNQSPMLLGPTEAIYDNAKAHRLTVRAYGERGANVITPANATWTDIYNDWKNGTSNVTIDARAIIVGLRDVYHPHYAAAESRVPDNYRADVFLTEFADFEKNGNLPRLVLILLYDDHTEGTSPGFPTPRAMVADNGPRARPHRRGDLEEPVLEGVGDLRHRGRLAGRPRSRGRPPHRRPGDQPLHPPRRRRQQLLLDRQRVSHDRADPRPAAEKPVRRGRRADLLAVHVAPGPDAVHGASEPDPVERDEPGARRPLRAAASAGGVLARDGQLGARLGAGRHPEPRDLALGERLRRAVQLRPADSASAALAVLAAEARGTVARARRRQTTRWQTRSQSRRSTSSSGSARATRCRA
jgi:YVTN family beta-propeller protein